MPKHTHHTRPSIGGGWWNWREPGARFSSWRGLDRLLVRGSAKVLTVAIWAALAYNLMRAIKLGWL